MAGRAPADARVAAMLARHGGTLMRVARQWSLCHDDALDAFQRGLEIYVRRLESVEPATEAAWLKVVIRHEAMAIRHARSDCLPDGDLDLDAHVPAPQRSVEEQVLSGDRVSRSAEALRALKPDEARALMLKAHGLSYEEIARHCGWTYTKVNRAITEGRRRFREVYGALEAGAECERFAPVLRALASGSATSEQLVEIRPHLRRCPACRATVRDLHRSGVRKLPLHLPVPAVVALQDWLRERLPGGGHGARAPEVALSWMHRTAPVPDLSRIRVGSRGVELPDAAVVEEHTSRLERFKQQAAAIVQRTNSSDLAAGIHAMTASGGGRIATVGAMLGLCLSGAGVGTVCLVTGVLKLQKPPVSDVRTRANKPPHRLSGPQAHPHRTPANRGYPPRLVVTSSEPSAPATRVAVRRRSVAGRAPHSAADPPAPAAKPEPAQDASGSEFSFETAAPAPAAATAPQATTTASTPSSSHPGSSQSTADPADEEFGP